MTKHFLGLLALLFTLAVAPGLYAQDTPMPTEPTTPTEPVEPTMSDPASEQPAMQQPNIVGLAQGNADLSSLVEAVQAAQLAETLQGEGPFTVFAPTNAAFTALPAGTWDSWTAPENQEALAGVLTYHVVPGRIMASDLVDGMELTTVNGNTLTVSVSDGTIMVGDAVLTTPSHDASNGTVYVIDKVLVPPTDMNDGM